MARGWEVTVFHRGTGPAPAGVRALHGDRTAADGLAALSSPSGPEEWDAVVDTWSAAPSVVRDSARLLAPRAGRYAYVSSRSVYAYPAAPGGDETRAVVDGDPDAGDVEYAQAKRGGELAALDSFGAARTLLLRAGLVLGPYENIGRLPWWLTRIARGGDVLAPGPREQGLQYVDARDLAAFTLDALRDERSGPYDVVCPRGFASTGELLEACVAAVNPSGARLRWTDAEVILAAGIEPWLQLPAWLPPGEDYDALMTSDTARAQAAGLRCRPVTETVRDTWAWLTSIGGTAPQRGDRPVVGLDPGVEAGVLGR
ncbi:hypothetical protein SRB5_49910 [Streptomyces sp. RB5]|uniref:NAD-dependent epimerase/dehydratase domain-containing protein n=1 Tax=Streptomyces smaragdinus TaxID=2585196 RepID=A0A7K0CMV9_9ACTN|nr:hypothetical protein [Streptomyces smaragdinus]